MYLFVFSHYVSLFLISAADSKVRWRNIRGRYTKYKQSLKFPSGAKRPKPYYLASHLQFLDSFLKSRPSRANIIAKGQSTQQKVENSDDDTSNIENESDTQGSTQNTNQLTSNSPPSTPLPAQIPEHNHSSGHRKRRRSPVANVHDMNTSSCTYFEAKQRLIEQQGNSASHCDPDMAFFQSILPDMKAMNDRQKRSFKMGILRLADEILYKSEFSIKDPISECFVRDSQ